MVGKKELFKKYRKAVDSGELHMDISFVDYLVGIIHARNETVKLLTIDVAKFYVSTKEVLQDFQNWKNDPKSQSFPEETQIEEYLKHLGF